MPVLQVSAGDEGVRADRFLRQRLAQMPLSQVYRLIRTGAVRRNGKKIRNDERLAPGDELVVRVAEAEILTPGAPDNELLRNLASTGFFRRNFTVVFEDEVLLACDKPGGLVVHPGSGHALQDTLLGLAAAYLLRDGGGEMAAQPCLVHRIDRDTSGLILLAKQRGALRRLHESLRQGHFEKRYVALCHGAPPRSTGSVRSKLVRTRERNDGTKMRVGEQGQEAHSRYRVLRRGNGVSLLDIELDTGRTHQIRVQMAHLGCPVVGDVRYGDAARDRQLFAACHARRRLYLHAASLCFPHPLSGERLRLEAPVPECFDAVPGARPQPERSA